MVMEYVDIVYSQDDGGNIDDALVVACAWNLPADTSLIRHNWDDLPNADKGDERHPEYNFLRVAWAGTFLIGGGNIFQSWSEEDNVTADWFVAHKSVVEEGLDGHGSFVYTDVDMEARTCTSRIESSNDCPYWAGFLPTGYAPDIKYMKCMPDEGSDVICCTVIAEDWDSWVCKGRDVLAGATEIIESPAIGKPVYITFSADCVVNGNSVGRGDTLKLTSSSFEIVANTNTKLIAHYSLGE